MARKDIDLFREEAHHGKQPNQKIKPYLVLQYLLENTDEDHPLDGKDIAAKVSDEYGISAERRSIYRDIEEINRVALMLEEGCKIDEATEMLAADDSDDLRLVVYKHPKGYYVRQRKYDLNDIRLLTECIYSSKFLSKGQADRLAGIMCDFVSVHQAEKIKHNALLTDRIQTNNRQVLANIATINEAMSRRLDGRPHTPEKISFQYQKYTISDVRNQVDRRHGERYIVNPFQLLINDGYYYLLTYDERKQEIRTYRVDRMKNVAFTGEPRDGEEEFSKIDLQTYTQRVFSMFGGEQKRVEIRFINRLLDTVVDRFGTKSVQYFKVDDRHFSVSVKVEISDQFYGWLLGFGKRAKLLGPPDAVDGFRAYLDKVREMY